MDFRNICSKFDMDAIKAKIPPLPDVLTQFKLPKSIGKLKARSKIFRSSREDVPSSIKRSSKEDVTMPMGAPLTVPSSSDFINHTPQRISTISSLVDQKAARSRPPAASIRRKNAPQSNETFYHSAGGIDDYCPTPPRHTFNNSIYDISMSPKAKDPEEETQKASFVNRMQKSYKDVSDFKLKHIFVKKTVVRQDNIALHQYIDQYANDRRSQERHDDKLDHAIADNYEFEFKISRRKSEESFGISTPSDSPTNAKANRNARKLLSEHSGDESGMELSPPNRKPGIAATRFARVRKVPLRMSIDEDDNSNQKQHNASVDNCEEDEEEEETISRATTLPTVRRQKSNDDLENTKPSPPKSKSFKQRFNSLTRQARSTETKDTPKKRRAPLSPQESAEVPSPGSRPSSPPENKTGGKQFGAIKENIRRFQKSFKLSTASLAQSGAESGADETNDKAKTSKTQQFTERLKRFRSVDNVDRQTDDDQEHEEKTGSPMHKITTKLQEWKKSMKKKTPTQNTDDEDGCTSPQKRDKPVGSLMKRLKYMRSRKNQSTDDPDDDEEGGATYREGFRERAKLQLEKGVAAASHMPQMTMDKLKETKKYFRKTQDKNKESKAKQQTSNNNSDESDLEEASESSKRPRPQTKVNPKAKDPTKAAATRHYYSSDDEHEEDDDDHDRQHLELCKVTSMEPHQPKVLVPLARAAWTNKSIHSDSIDTADDDDDMLPRVLLHQNNSDVFESTIIIAVTRPMSRSHSPSPFITELPPESPTTLSPKPKADSWVCHQDIVSGFREHSVPIRRELSKDTITSVSSSKGHSRKHSMDSSSDDSWIKDIPRGVSTAVGLNRVCEMDEPWKGQVGKKNQGLYKSKSIDIFEKTQGGLKIFEDFDDELKNTPVVKIEKSEMDARKVEVQERQSNREDSHEQDSGEELEDNADDDNSSRVTRILKQQVEIKEAEAPPVNVRDLKLKTHLYGNSAESLMGHLNAKNNSDEDESEDENSNEEDDDADEDEDDDDEEESDEVHNRPPSVAPSPPPSMPSPPPPLPQRQPSIRLSKLTDAPSPPQHPPPPPPPDELPPSPPKTQPPPMPQSKPPLPPNRPGTAALPKIPERTPSMSRVAKPLVKTSSLRLTYDEQVNPNDVGKVNKLISKFEPNGSSIGRRERPRLIPRIPFMTQSSEDYSEDEEEVEEDEDINESNQNNGNRVQGNSTRCSSRELSLEKTPTNKPNKPKIQKSFSIDADEVLLTPVNNNLVIREDQMISSTRISNEATAISVTVPPPPREKAPLPAPYIPSISISCLSLQSDQNSNFSQASSEYGSPMTYPSSRIGSNEGTPQNSPKDMLLLTSNRRSRRSMTRDDERYFSFDSDEENSYYSIGSNKSSRYIVDL